MAVLHNSPFTGTAGTAVNTLSPTVGNALVNVTGTAITDGTRMRRANAAGTIRVRTADAFGTADYSVTCVFNSLASSSPNIFEIAGRYVDTNNHYYLDFVQSVGQIRLRKRVAGTASTLTGGTGTFTWSSFTHGVDYTLMLRMEGTAITGWLDGTQVVSGTDSSFTSAGEASVLLTGNTGTTPDTEAFRAESLVVEDFIVGGGGGVRRRVMLRAPKNTQRAFTPQSRLLFGATRTFQEPIGPTPDAAVTNRRKVGAFVKRGGVGRLRRGR